MGSWAGSSQGVVAACLWLDPPCLARGLGWVGVQLLWQPGRKGASVWASGVPSRCSCCFSGCSLFPGPELPWHLRSYSESPQCAVSPCLWVEGGC